MLHNSSTRTATSGHCRGIIGESLQIDGSCVVYPQLYPVLILLDN